MLSSASVRVGVNAARLAYPAPSGVVNYRLREAGPANELRLGAGVRDFGTQVLQGDGSYRSGAFSFAGGFLWRPLHRHPQGYEGVAFNLGGVFAWDIAPDQRLRAFASMYKRHYDGDYAVVANAGAMPPPLRRLHQYSPRWAETAANSTNMGVLYDARFGRFSVDASAFRSIFDIEQNDFTLISSDGAGRATATTLRSPGRTKIADSVEARIGRPFEAGALDQRVTLSLRGGRTTAEFGSNLAVPLGAFQLPGDPPEVPEIKWSGMRGEDRVEQVTASAGYTLAWDDRLQLRLGIHRIRYDKAVRSILGTQTGRVSKSTHYNASAVFNLTDRTALFGSWVTGLEESGVAPLFASNGDEVLPPGDVEQFELGVRHALSPRLTFIGAFFDVSKPSQGLRSDGSFGLVGEVDHRGVEASIAGELNDRIKIVVGAVAFDSAVTGALVDAGIVGSEGVGVSQRAASASIEYQLRDGWSLDANLNYSGERWTDTANTLRAPAVTTLGIGLRHNFTLAGRPAALRIVASNITGADGYLAARSGLLSPIAPPTIRAVLTLTFGPSE
ncbi:TonB-dependent receptor [Lysobacter sp. ISL-42]|uniref:TonB-dependent receptor domain-containing protein n=1 Tax=Lysobacter sp. ISL-42 TaxID=2819152 RepID=UPI001BE9188A|nr:TonB-dependent receptor [Lysobacter sp. ISL-42]